jgi:hypothetical protein
MTTTPIITIYARHSAGCKYEGSEFSKRCDCRKWLDAVYVVVRAPQNAVVENQSHEYQCQRVHGLFQLMRYTGLSIQDALTLPRSA